jgi:hypothetical protein
MFIGTGGEGARDLFGCSKVSSSARANQAAFFACKIWNIESRVLSSPADLATAKVMASVKAKPIVVWVLSTAEPHLLHRNHVPRLFHIYVMPCDRGKGILGLDLQV